MGCITFQPLQDLLQRLQLRLNRRSSDSSHTHRAIEQNVAWRCEWGVQCAEGIIMGGILGLESSVL